jgi:hypothetical protein
MLYTAFIRKIYLNYVTLQGENIERGTTNLRKDFANIT